MLIGNRLFLTATLGFLLAAFASTVCALTVPPELCREAPDWRGAPAQLAGRDDSRPLLAAPGHGHRVWRLVVTAPGVLSLEIFPRPRGSAGPRLELLDGFCQKLDAISSARGVTRVESSSGRAILKLREPGEYHIAVSTPAAMPAGLYRLRGGFSTGEDLSRLALAPEDGPALPYPKESCHDSGEEEVLAPLRLAEAFEAPAVLLVRGEQATLEVRRPGVVERVETGLLLKVERGTYHLGFSGLDGSDSPFEPLRFYASWGRVDHAY